MPEQSLPQTPDLQVVPDRSMRNNGKNNSAGSMEERPVLNHSSETIPRNDILHGQAPSRSAAASHSIYFSDRDIPFYPNKNIDKNGISNKPFYEHNAREHNNNPLRVCQVVQTQRTASPQISTNDYGQLSSISQETTNQNRHFLPQENCKRQGYSNSVNVECQPQQAHLYSQPDQTQLPMADNGQSNFDHDYRWNERHDCTYINGCRVRRDVDKSHVKKDSRSNISPSNETSRPRATRPNTENLVSSQGLLHEFNHNYRNTSFAPGGKTVNTQKYKCIVEDSKNNTFKVRDPWDFSNKLEDLNREYRSTKKKRHVEILLASNSTKHETS